MRNRRLLTPSFDSFLASVLYLPYVSVGFPALFCRSEFARVNIEELRNSRAGT